MACATLKRSLDLDPLYSPTSRPSKRRRYAGVSSPSAAAIAPSREEVNSPFAAVTPTLTTEQISTHIREEMKRLKSRRQLCTTESGSSQPPSPGSSGIGIPSEFHLESLGSPSSSQANKDKDKPLFTFRQVGLICERMMKEREDCLREMYDQVLSTKLAEQYDMFVKFTYDQIQKRCEATAPSYLS